MFACGERGQDDRKFFFIITSSFIESDFLFFLMIVFRRIGSIGEDGFFDLHVEIGIKFNRKCPCFSFLLHTFLNEKMDFFNMVISYFI